MKTDFDKRPLGALPQSDGGGVLFRLWSPEAERASLVLEDSAEPLEMESAGHGYFELRADDAAPGTRYRFSIDGGNAMPDPASRFQPEGVHGPSEVVDPAAYAWQDQTWEGLPQEDLVFYELHPGTFTPEGTFDAVREKLSYLKDLGVTAVELMPVADFPGARNWGYDPAAFYAASRAYGRPDDLRCLVDAAHQTGLAVFLDVIYNHLGPDGAYVAAFAPMFTQKHETPWGQAVNLDDTHSAGVRHFFIDNALMWLREYHFDGLRLDATFALRDDSPTHFLAALSDAVDGLPQTSGGPRRLLIAEDNRNERRLLVPRQSGGYGLDGVWADDLHHQMRNFTAGDKTGYFKDFAGTTAEDLAQTLRQGWFYTGAYAEHFGEPRGTSTEGLSKDKFVVCIQNHDQVGNRPQGTRLSDDVAPEVYRAASALLLFAPELPLLFMGQEWATLTPFQFFTDHNEELGRLVTEGRKEEFGHFPGMSEEDVPDPQLEETFERSKLRWDEREAMPHAGTLALYRDLLALRRDLPPADERNFEVEAHGARGLVLRRGPYTLAAAFADDLALPVPGGAKLVLHTEAEEYVEDGQPPQIQNGEARFARAGAVVVEA